MLGMFLAALDQTIVATSIRTIGDDLHGLSLQAWVTTAYLLTATISTPLYGKLSDIYGRKPLYMISISIFVVGLAAVRHRRLDVPAGGLPRRSRASAPAASWRWRSRSSATSSPRGSAPATRATSSRCSASSSVLGPVVGGFFAGAETILGITGWRWVFLINVPIGIIAIIVIARVLHLPPLKRVDAPDRLPGRARARSSRWCRCWSSPSRAASGAGTRRGRWPATSSACSAWSRSSWPSGTPRPTRSCRCTCSGTARSRWAPAPTPSSASACSAASRRCRCTCRSSRARPPPRPA